MSLRAPIALAFLVAVIALPGCTSIAVPPSAHVGVAADALVSVSDEPAAALVLSAAEITLVSAEGTTLRNASFEAGSDVLALLVDVLGTEPQATPVPAYPVVTYEWADVSLSIESDTFASVTFHASETDGLELRTSEGAHVGMTWDQARDIGADLGADLDGNGQADGLRLKDPASGATISLAFATPKTGEAVTTITAPVDDDTDRD